MQTDRFQALILDKGEDGNLVPEIRTLGLNDLPEGDVVVEVRYSSINYKDAMAIGNRGIIRKFPAIPGIDFAGIVLQSENPKYKAGDEVVLTGWGVGERHWGGYSQVARVKGEWLVPLPAGLSMKQSMQVGTAGLTAMLCVQAIEHQDVLPGSGPVLVTGASGGVGSVAVAVLAGLGYEVWAMSRPGQDDYLKSLGAVKIVGRDEFTREAKPGRPVLEAETFAGAIDTVGGATLAALIARIAYRGAVAACGLVGGNEVDTTVYPFILRGVALLGVDSVRCPTSVRTIAWQRIAKQLPLDRFAGMSREVGLAGVPAIAAEMLAGRGHGRVVVNLQA